MKRIFIVLSALLILTLAGCKTQTSGNTTAVVESGGKTAVSETERKEQERQKLKTDTLTQDSHHNEDWMSVNIPDAGLKDLSVLDFKKGYVTSEANPENVYLLGDHRYEEPAFAHDNYLVVSGENGVWLKELLEYSSGDFLYLVDVDGDKLKEIVVQQGVAGSCGGAGAHVSVIFKATGDGIKTLYDSEIENARDTGFTGTLTNGFKIKIKNTYTGYQKIVDLSKKEYADMIFDKSGKVIEQHDVDCDSFFEFKPKDIDGDGVYEIACSQYMSLNGHSNDVGEAKSVLKYNTKTSKFEVIEASFGFFD